MNTKSNSLKRDIGGNILAFILRNKAIVLFLVLSIFAACASEHFLTSKNILNVIRQISAGGVLAAGFTCVLAFAHIDLSVGTMLGMIGIISAKLAKDAGFPFWLVVVVALGIGLVCGVINGAIITYLKVNFFIATLATQLVFKGVCYVISHNSAVAGLPDEFTVIGQGYLGPIPIPIYILIAVGVIVAVILYKTAFGRHIIAGGGNEQAARVSGINVNAVRMGVYTLMGVCAGIAALIMTGRAQSAQPAAGQGMEMDAIAAVVIGGTPLSGGKGNVVGTIFGCLIVGVINNILNLTGLDSNFQIVAKGLLILFAVVLDVQTEAFFAKRRNRTEE